MIHTVEVWGDLACFTRPEAKAERLTYPLITPSAARGIFDAIYWTAQDDLFWQLLTIELLEEPQYIALRRHEVREKSGLPTRTTRQTIALKNVRYRLSARLQSRSDQPLTRHDKQFTRRLRLGQCRYQPYLGCREFTAYFSAPESDRSPIPLDLDLGLMLYDVFDLARSGTHSAAVSLFHAVLQQGILHIPEYTDARVLKCSTV